MSPVIQKLCCNFLYPISPVHKCRIHTNLACTSFCPEYPCSFASSSLPPTFNPFSAFLYISLIRPKQQGKIGGPPLSIPPFATPQFPFHSRSHMSLGKGYWKVVQLFVFVCVQGGEDVHPASNRHTPMLPPSALIGQSARTQTHTKAAHAFLNRAPAGDT